MQNKSVLNFEIELISAKEYSPKLFSKRNILVLFLIFHRYLSKSRRMAPSVFLFFQPLQFPPSGLAGEGMDVNVDSISISFYSIG